MTVGDALELIGIILGLLVFPGIPLTALAGWLIWVCFAKWLLNRRVRIRTGFESPDE